MEFTIVDATSADLPSITAIFNDAILNSVAAWHETARSDAEMADWLETRSRDYAALVARGDDGALVGFAAYGPFRAYSGYRLTAEHSVYVRADRRGAGIGRHLVEALIARARNQGLHVLVGALDSDNRASMKLHALLGFTETARMPEVGRKFDRWLTLVLVQKIL